MRELGAAIEGHKFLAEETKVHRQDAAGWSIGCSIWVSLNLTKGGISKEPYVELCGFKCFIVEPQECGQS